MGIAPLLLISFKMSISLPLKEMVRLVKHTLPFLNPAPKQRKQRWRTESHLNFQGQRDRDFQKAIAMKNC